MCVAGCHEVFDFYFFLNEHHMRLSLVTQLIPVSDQGKLVVMKTTNKKIYRQIQSHVFKISHLDNV